MMVLFYIFVHIVSQFALVFNMERHKSNLVNKYNKINILQGLFSDWILTGI